MAMSVEMYWYMDQHLSDDRLASIRSDLMTRFDLPDDDFHSGGPLVHLPPEDFDFIGREGETGCLISLNSIDDYYGVGYERGPLPFYVQVAEGLESQIPNSLVYYGEDSSGIGRLFDQAEREKLLRYYNAVGHQPYLDHSKGHLRQQYGS